MNWITTFDAFETVAADAEPWVKRCAVEAAVVALRDAMQERIADPVGDVTVRLSDQHNDYFVRHLEAALAECRGLVRLHPNPMPRIVLFPRWERVVAVGARTHEAFRR